MNALLKKCLVAPTDNPAHKVAADLFQAPLIEFRHGLAAEILIIVIAVTGAMSIRLLRRGDSNQRSTLFDLSVKV